MIKHPVSVKIFGHRKSHWDRADPEAGKGIHFITNGWVLSAQAGVNSYCSVDPRDKNSPMIKPHTLRPDCEIALWPVNEPIPGLEFKEDQYSLGWIPWQKVIEILWWLMTLDHVPAKDEVRRQVLSIARRREVRDVG